MSLILVSGPASFPVKLAEAKEHLKITSGNAEDTLISRLIRAATVHAENFTRRAFITQTWRKRLDDFTDYEITLDKPPIQSITSVKYYTGGVLTTLNGTLYESEIDGETGFVRPIYGGYWPTYVDPRYGAVQVDFVAGYGDDPEDVPEDIRQAILFLVGHFYANKESVISGATATEVPQTFEALLWPYRFLRFV